MYKNRIFKSFWGIVGSAALVGVVSISAVACGHKSTTVNTWDAFKKAALAETAPKLKSTIINLKQYYWTNNDVAIFDSNNGSPDISVTDAQTIVATIAIKDKTSQLQYPIKFKIKYLSGFKYDLKDWYYTQTPGLNKWSTFKVTAAKITAAALLAQAKTSKALSTLTWGPDSKTNTWKDSYTAEFDVYGGKEMNGNPTSDNTNFSVTAIISIKDPLKQGLYDANPIKAVINDNDNKNYSLSSWKFSVATQSQSIDKYTNLVKDQIKLAKAVKDPGDASTQAAWGKFANQNWFYDNDSSAYSTIYKYLTNKGYPKFYGVGCIGDETKTEIPITGGISSVISLSFWSDATKGVHTNHFYFTLTNNFLFNTTDKNSGPAFSSVWTVSKPHKKI